MTHLERIVPTLLILALTGCGGDAAPAGGDGAGGDGGDASAAGDTAAAVDTGEADRNGGDAAHRPDYVRLRAQVCDTLTNSFDCARAIEDRQLPDAEAVGRHGDTLRLALHEDTARFVDQPGDHAEVVYYSYQNHWPDQGLFLVQKQYYEGSEYVLVNDSTGAQTHIPDWPLRSPDGRRFAVLSLDLVAGYGPNTLQVWEIEEGTPERVWETEPSQWGPTDGSWSSPTTLELTQRGYCSELGGEGRSMCDRPARLQLDGGSWHLDHGELRSGDGTRGGDRGR